MSLTKNSSPKWKFPLESFIDILIRSSLFRRSELKEKDKAPLAD